MDEKQSIHEDLRHIIASVKSSLILYLVQNPERRQIAIKFLNNFSSLSQELQLALVPELKKLSSKLHLIHNSKERNYHTTNK